MSIKHMCLILVAIGGLSLTPHAFAAEQKENHYRASDVFDLSKNILFQDDLRSGQFGKWTFSEDDHYRLAQPTQERVAIVDAPQLAAGSLAQQVHDHKIAEADAMRAEAIKTAGHKRLNLGEVH